MRSVKLNKLPFSFINNDWKKTSLKELSIIHDSAQYKEYDKIIQKYYKSIKKSCGIKPAAQFFQIEAYFQSAIRKTIFENIPLIGELEK